MQMYNWFVAWTEGRAYYYGSIRLNTRRLSNAETNKKT